jgi:hypothetical protein
MHYQGLQIFSRFPISGNVSANNKEIVFKVPQSVESFRIIS